MILKAIKYCRFLGEDYEWAIEGKPFQGNYNQMVSFRDINLVVGKNATGKSKSIDAIRQLADLFSGNRKVSQLFYDTSFYNVIFDDKGIEYDYFLEFKKGKVERENLKVDNVEKLNRNGDTGKLFYVKVGESGEFLDFQMEDDKLAVSRVDTIQQPFFEPLHNWGNNLNHYRFGGKLGKDTLIRDVNLVKDDKDVDLKDTDQVTEIFLLGKLKYQNAFTDKIIEDMKSISYNINKIDAFTINFFPVTAFGLGVQEDDVVSITDQKEMSQGMFRALSLIVQLNYSLLTKNPSCVLIDDIGEGLDYDRSKSLIDLIINKVRDSNIQVIMTTNDRFVMNEIPLEYWSVIHRISKKSLFYNYSNSKDVFDEFKYTGLSNFDFLTSQFYFDGFQLEEGN